MAAIFDVDQKVPSAIFRATRNSLRGDPVKRRHMVDLNQWKAYVFNFNPQTVHSSSHMTSHFPSVNQST